MRHPSQTIDTMSKHLCIYHGDHCNDGFAAASGRVNEKTPTSCLVGAVGFAADAAPSKRASVARSRN